MNGEKSFVYLLTVENGFVPGKNQTENENEMTSTFKYAITFEP